MALKKYKTNSLFWMFLKQLLMLSACILIEIASFVMIFYIGINFGFILPANYSEHYFEKNKDRIAKSEPFDKNLIPVICKYGLFDLNGEYLSGNFSKDIADDAKVFIKDAEGSNYRFFLIERADGYCVVQYDISAHFASGVLHKFFPKLELMVFILFLLIFIAIVINNALSFGRKLKKELNPLLEEINLIQNRELNLERKNSKIKEINDILLSLYDMELALSRSLKKEWETEQKRKSNISALAHDIKTPLTIIKGNSELILEEEDITQIYQFADIINFNSDKIERYIKLLIDETKNNFIVDNQEKTDLSIIITDILTESEALCKTNGIELISHNTVSETEVIVNRDFIERAVLNLLKNAVEHTITTKKVMLNFKGVDHKFIVEIEDFGKGFSRAALKCAKNQFYTEKSERSEEHYGLGMYFASNVAEKYHGSLTFYNKPNETGSVVVFEVQII